MTLLGRVFRSWLSRGDASVPVNPDVISDLKKTARLLHYCTSPLLIQRCLATPLSPADGTWLDSIKKDLFGLYIDYLTSLGFQVINERASSKVKSRPSPKSPPPSLLYKCLQRSWPAGVMMVEVLIEHLELTVRLYTLEGSRLQQSTPLGPEGRSSFAKQCAHFRDFIHVHSFLHDFHLRFLLYLVDGKIRPPGEFHLTQYLQLCYNHYTPPPSFTQNLLNQGEWAPSRWGHYTPPPSRWGHHTPPPSKWGHHTRVPSRWDHHTHPPSRWGHHTPPLGPYGK